MKAKDHFARAARRHTSVATQKKSAPPRGQGTGLAPAPPAPTGPAPPMPKSARGMEMPKIPPGWKAPAEKAEPKSLTGIPDKEKEKD